MTPENFVPKPLANPLRSGRLDLSIPADHRPSHGMNHPPQSPHREARLPDRRLWSFPGASPFRACARLLRLTAAHLGSHVLHAFTDMQYQRAFCIALGCCDCNDLLSSVASGPQPFRCFASGTVDTTKWPNVSGSAEEPSNGPFTRLAVWRPGRRDPTPIVGWRNCRDP